MRHRVRNLSAGLLALLLGVSVPLTITTGNDVVGGNITMIALWTASAASAFVWIVCTDTVAKRIPWEIRRKRPRRPIPPQIADLLAGVTPPAQKRKAVSTFIDDGRAILAAIKVDDGPKEKIVAAIVNIGQVAKTREWHTAVSEYLRANVEDLAGLYNHRAEPPTHVAPIPAFVNRRIAELQRILMKL